MDEEFQNWLKTRPAVIQELGNKYPPGEYIIKSGAPYGISCEGTKVHLFSYHEDGTVSVVVMAGDKTPAGLAHEDQLCELHGKDKAMAHKANVKVNIDPEWMQPVT